MTLTFNFKLMDYQELNGTLLSVSLGQFRRFLYQSKALSERNSTMRTIFENEIPGTSIVFCVQSLCGLKFELRVRSKAIFVKTRLNYVTNRQLNAFENQMPEISAIYSRK